MYTEKKRLLGAAADRGKFLIPPTSPPHGGEMIHCSSPWRGNQPPAWASSQLLHACRCEAEQTGRKCKVLSLHQLLPNSDREQRVEGEEISGKMSAARRGGDDLEQFSPSGGVAALRRPPSPEGSPVGPVVTSSLIKAGGQSAALRLLRGSGRRQLSSLRAESRDIRRGIHGQSSDTVPSWVRIG